LPPAIRVVDESEFFQQPEPFKDEDELQEILVKHPVLLADRNDRDLIALRRGFPLEGGYADLFLVDANGLPVIVEVKLARNRQSRREVIGQLFDYLSSVARLTPNEVNARLKIDEAIVEPKNLLEDKLRLVASVKEKSNSESNVNQIKSNFGAYLRAGQIRGIIVLDNASDDLIREFSYLNEHNDLDLRLLVVERYKLNSNEYFYHSRFLVSGDPDFEIKRQRFRLRQVIEKFKMMMLPEFSVSPTPSNDNYRVSRQGWPKGVHYEFSDWKDSISIEIQVKSEEYPKIAEFLSHLRDSLPKLISDIRRVELPPTDKHGWRRLKLYFSEEIDPYIIARSMVVLCETEKDISTLLQEGNE